MIGLGEVERLVRIALLTGHIAQERPLSLLLISKIEAGKTELLKRYSQVPGVAWLDDATAYGIARRYKEEIEMGKIKHLIFPDMLRPLARAKETVQTFINFLNMVTEEGISHIETFAQQNFEIKRGAQGRCGVLAGIAHGEMLDARHKWTRIGFLSRMLPVCWEYGDRTIYKIQDSLANRAYIGDKAEPLELPVNPIPVQLSTELAAKTIETASKLGKAEDVYGFRKQRQLQVLMMGNALLEGRDYVTEHDFEVMDDLSDYFILGKKLKVI